MNRLTRQEQLIICAVMTLLLAVWAIKAYRVAHPAVAAISDSAKH